MYQRRRFYQILCSSAGVHDLCDILFNSIQFRDFRMAANVTLQQLEYCVVISSWARIASVAIESGYVTSNVPELSQLLKSVVGIQLPAVLAKYIESMGVFKLANGCEVAPWFAERETMQNHFYNQLNPDDLLRAAQRPIPPNYWSIDRDWISTWNQATTRPSRLGMHFRPLTWSEIAGTPEMIVSPTISEDGEYLRPTAPQQLTDVEGSLGAVYRWRDYDALRHWPEQTALICTRLFFGTELYLREYWSDTVVHLYI